MTLQTVTVEADAAFVHEGRAYHRGDRLPMSRDDALDLQALALAHIVVIEESGAGGNAAASPSRSQKTPRSGPRNRYLRRDLIRDDSQK